MAFSDGLSLKEKKINKRKLPAMNKSPDMGYTVSIRNQLNLVKKLSIISLSYGRAVTSLI